MLGGSRADVRDLNRQAGSEEESPVHGSNLWPSQDPEFEKLLRSHLEACLHVGQTLMRGEMCFLSGFEPGKGAPVQTDSVRSTMLQGTYLLARELAVMAVLA